MSARRATAMVLALAAVLLVGHAGAPLREPGEAAAVDAGSRAIDVVAHLAGRSPAVARVPAIAGGLLALVGAAWAAAAVSWRAAVIAALVLALSPAWYVGARDAGGVGLALGATTIAAAGALHWMLRGRARDVVIAYAATIAAVATGGLVPTVVAPLAVIAVGARGARRRAVLGGALLAAAALLAALVLGGEAWWGGAAREARPTFEAMLDQLGHGLFPWAGLLPIAIGAALVDSGSPFDSGASRPRSGRTESGVSVPADDERHEANGGDDRRGNAPSVALIAATAAACAAWSLAHAAHAVGPLPAFALAAALVGVALDEILAGPGWPLAALVAALAAVLLALDVRDDAVVLAGAGTRNVAWTGADLGRLALAGGLAAAVGLALALAASRARVRLVGLAVAALAAATVAIALTWSALPDAARASSMAPLAAAHDRTGGGPLVVLGGDGHAFAYLTSAPVIRAADVATTAAALATGDCPHAIAPIAELAPLQRALPADRHAHVLARRRDLVLLAACLPPGARDLDPLPAALAAPALPRAAAATWQDTVQLVGLAVPARARPGDVIELALAFRVVAPPPSPRLLFVRFLGCDEALPPIDRVLVDGAYPTSAWRAGDTITDRFTLAIPRDAAPCAYDVVVGWRAPDRPRDRLRLDPTTVPGNRSQVAEGAAIATIVVEP